MHFFVLSYIDNSGSFSLYTCVISRPINSTMMRKNFIIDFSRWQRAEKNIYNGIYRPQRGVQTFFFFSRGVECAQRRLCTLELSQIQASIQGWQMNGRGENVCFTPWFLFQLLYTVSPYSLFFFPLEIYFSPIRFSMMRFSLTPFNFIDFSYIVLEIKRLSSSISLLGTRNDRVLIFALFLSHMSHASISNFKRTKEGRAFTAWYFSNLRIYARDTNNGLTYTKHPKPVQSKKESSTLSPLSKTHATLFETCFFFFLFHFQLKTPCTHVLKVRRIQARCVSSVDALRRAGLRSCFQNPRVSITSPSPELSLLLLFSKW